YYGRNGPRWPVRSRGWARSGRIASHSLPSAPARPPVTPSDASPRFPIQPPRSRPDPPRCGMRMIRSMTAFASAERGTRWGTIAAELRSVNHRFLELAVKAPEELRGAEPALRERVAGRLQRGKADLTLRFRPAAGGGGELSVDSDMVERLSALYSELRHRFPDLRLE